jgi:hypothetical protein
MDNIFNLIGIAVIGNMIAYWFLPIQAAKRRFIELFTFTPFFHKAIDKALNCSKCMSFWVYLIVCQDVVLAALCSFVGYLINFTIDKIQFWYED